MAVVDKPSAREAKRLQTKERLMGAAIAEFKRSGMADADVGAIVTAAGVAHGTFFFHFPTKEHVLLELEHREEERIAKQLGRFLESKQDLASVLNEAVRLVVGLERRLGDLSLQRLSSTSFFPDPPSRRRGQGSPGDRSSRSRDRARPRTGSGGSRGQPHEQRGVLPPGSLCAVDHHQHLADARHHARRLRGEGISQHGSCTSQVID